MEEDLLGAVMYGLIQMHTHAPPCTNRVSDRPRAYPVALWQAKAGEALTNAHHEMVELDQFAVEVLTLADGKRTAAAITDWFVRAFERGDLGLDQDGVPITAREPAREMLAAKVELALALLARSALLVE